MPETLTLSPAEPSVETRSASLIETSSHPDSPLTMVHQVCCICGVSDEDVVGVGEDFEYRTTNDTHIAVQCRRCGLVYQDPRPDEAELSRIYPSDYHAFQFQAESFGFVCRVRQRLKAGRLKRWMKGLPHDARILDVGCGDGFHLKLLRDHGQKTWTLEGLDADQRAVDAATDGGLNVQLGRVEDNSLAADAYDFVIMIMTIEHVANPIESLAAVQRVLKPGGRLVVITDNTQTLHHRLFKGRH